MDKAGKQFAGFVIALAVLIAAGGVVGVWTSVFGSGGLGGAIGVAVIAVALALWIGKYQRQGRASQAYFEDR